MITVLRDRYSRSWPERDPSRRLRPGDRAYVLDLGKALAREYRTDAHFVAYPTPKGYRLNIDALDRGLAIELRVVVFDVDCPLVHGTSRPAPEEWRRELRDKVQALSAEHPAPYYYETRGGARIVYRHPEPTVIRNRDDAQRWSDQYLVAIAYLSRRFGVVADSACHDWQRLFRLPRATRTPGSAPENWPSLGEPDRIGTLTIRATEADVRAARTAYRAFRRRDRDREFTPSIASGEGLFYYLLRARGDVSDRPAPRGGQVVRCPNRRKHTINTDGTDSTVLYPPSPGKELGWICCKHSHCDSLTARGWLSLFTSSELEAARRAAGIASRDTDARRQYA